MPDYNMLELVFTKVLGPLVIFKIIISFIFYQEKCVLAGYRVLVYVDLTFAQIQVG